MRIAVPFTLLVLVLLAAGLVQAGPASTLLVARYKGGDVPNGGTIAGRVTIDPVPETTDFEVAKDVEICSHAKPNHRLRVDAETKGVASVVVYIDGIEKGKKLPRRQSFTIDQKGCQYVPFVSVVPKRSSLAFTSSDPILHNVHVFEGTPEEPHALTRDVLNAAMKDDRTPPAQLDRRALRRPGFFYVRCDAGHIWMSAYIWVVEHPYHVVTDEKGSFELTDVPPGTYTLRFWHPGWELKPKKQDGKVVGYDYGDPVTGKTTVEVKPGTVATASWTMPGS